MVTLFPAETNRVFRTPSMFLWAICQEAVLMILTEKVISWVVAFVETIQLRLVPNVGRCPIIFAVFVQPVFDKISTISPLAWTANGFTARFRSPFIPWSYFVWQEMLSAASHYNLE